MKTSPRLQFLQSLSVSVGMAFATSCFAMVAGMAAATGPWVLASIATSVLIALAVAHAIGRLARRFPSALGIRTYIKAAFGNTASLFFVFLYLFMITLIAGVESNMFTAIVQFLMPGIDAHLSIVGLFSVVLAMNVLGYEFSKNAQLVMVILLLSSVLGLSGYAIAVADIGPVLADAATPGRLAAVPEGIITAFFLYVGFEWVTSAQNATRSAAAQLPKVLFSSILLLGLVYLAFAAAAILHLPQGELQSTSMPQMLLAARLWGPVGSWLMLAASALAVLTGFNAGVLGGARLLYGMAREGFLPRVLGTTASFNGAPVPAIATTTAVCIGSALLIMRLGVAYLLGNVAAVVICLCYCALLASSLKLHRSPTRSAAQVAESCALVAMLLLLAALVFGGTSFIALQVVVGAGVVFAVLAVLAARRAARLAELATAAAISRQVLEQP